MALKHSAKDRQGGLWPEEIEAWKKIHGGETKMTLMTAEEFSAEMERIISERKAKERRKKDGKY
jgi:hypothetical protein